MQYEFIYVIIPEKRKGDEIIKTRFLGRKRKILVFAQKKEKREKSSEAISATAAET